MKHRLAFRTALASLTLLVGTPVFAQPAEEAPPEEAPAEEAPAEEGAAEEGAEEGEAAEEGAEGEEAAGEEAAEEPAEEPPPAEEAPAEPPPAEQPPPAVAPTEQPAAQPTPEEDRPALRFGTGNDDPMKDSAEKETDKKPKGQARVRWRGTGFSWGHTVTTTALGVGRDNIGGDGEVYTQSFSFVLNYYVLDGKGFKMRLATSPSWSQELTNSNVTTEEREVLFNDLPVSLVAPIPLWASEDKMWSTSLIANGTVIFPTSKFSRESGTNLVTSPRVLLFQGFPIAGKDSPVLKSGGIGVSARWDHAFTDANTPVNDDLKYPRQDAAGSTFLSDQLTGGALTRNSLRYTAFLFLQEQYGSHQIQFFTGGQIAHNYRTEFKSEECEVDILTGCVPGDRIDDPETTQVQTGFFASLNYFPRAEFGFGVGYSNAAGQLGLDGKRRNFFYSPTAAFNASLIISIDAIYEGLTGPKRVQPFVLLGKNDKRRDKKGKPAQRTVASSDRDHHVRF